MTKYKRLRCEVNRTWSDVEENVRKNQVDSKVEKQKRQKRNVSNWNTTGNMAKRIAEALSAAAVVTPTMSAEALLFHYERVDSCARYAHMTILDANEFALNFRH